jgi:hypothetical protein
MGKRLLDQVGSVKTWVDVDIHGNATVWDEFDVEREIRAVEVLSDMDKKHHVTEWCRHERVIPQFVMDRAHAEGWRYDPEAWARWANSEEGRFFAVQHDGKINRI